MQDGVRFVHDKAQLSLRWCFIQIKKRRGEAVEEIPNEEEAVASQIGPYQENVSFEDGNADPSAGASVPEPYEGETPHKKRRITQTPENPTKRWTPSTEMSGHIGEDSDTD